MKTNKRHKAGLYIGLLSLYTLSACNSTRQEYGEILHSPQTVHHSRSLNVSEIYDTYNPPAFSVTDGSVHSTMDRPYEKCAIDAIKNGERPGFWGTGKPIWSSATIIPMEPSPSKNARSQPTITPWLLSSLSLGSIALYKREFWIYSNDLQKYNTS